MANPEVILVNYIGNEKLGEVRINKEDFDADRHVEVKPVRKSTVNKESKYTSLKADELRAELNSRGIEYKSSASKGELVDLLDSSDEAGYKLAEGSEGGESMNLQETEE